MLPFLMCCHRGKSESVYHLSCPPGYVPIELEHDLDDDVFEPSFFLDMNMTCLRASPKLKTRGKKIFSGTIFITSLPWLLFGGWEACEEQRGTSKTPWDQSFEEPIRVKTKNRITGKLVEQ